MQILVTGAAGFIGAELSLRLLSLGHTVIGVDNLNDYYDVSLKQARLERLAQYVNSAQFSMHQISIEDRNAITHLFNTYQLDVVVNLAAQAGVRYSLENPNAYVDSNLVGFGNILEGCRQNKIGHLVYASSSSVYGANKNFPFSEKDQVDNPISLYAATKKANELMAHSYAHLYDIRCTGLRFFTVYGPWGRPDMAPFRFASRMLKGDEIPVYNNGNMIRDFTYIDDITEGLTKVVESQSSADKFSLYNIGRGEQVQLMDFIQHLSDQLGVEAKFNMMPMQDGDVPRTMANVEALKRDFAYQPSISVSEGVKRFAHWYKEYYR